MKQVEKIVVINRSGYVLSFSIQWLDANGKLNKSEWNSGNFPVGQSVSTPPLEDLGVANNALAVTPYGQPVMGEPTMGEPFVGFVPNGHTATYEAISTALGFTLKLVE